jgi:hypothetical protein
MKTFDDNVQALYAVSLLQAMDLGIAVTFKAIHLRGDQVEVAHQDRCLEKAFNFGVLEGMQY